ncbi:MAG: cation diffusion facilitator family transporter [Peptococcia bacterium]
MLSKLLVKRFIANHQDTNNNEIRKKYGVLSGIVGIILNLLLFVSKLFAGLVVNSIAMIADAFNNLSDVASSFVTVFGFVMAGKPADEEHPFGHGRYEYIAGMIISFLVILIGYEFFKSSLQRILNPSPVEYSHLALLILIASILAKGWLFFFQRHLARAISSTTLNASSFDSVSDVISTSCVLLSLLISQWTTFPIDGYIGIIVALLIIYAGISLTKETISPLLGEPAPQELVDALLTKVHSYPGIHNTHDLIIHNYGTGQYLASLHVEVPANVDIMEIHETIDQIEQEVNRDLNVLLSIHMDPINLDSVEYQQSFQEISKIIAKFPEVLSFHDLRLVGQGENKNILFDIVVRPGLSPKRTQDLKSQITAQVKKIHPNYDCIIDVDQHYI